MSDLFISDLHLSPDQPKLYSAFCAFLAQLDSSVEQLYILGDLFDIWVGLDSANHFQNEVIARLKMLEKRRIRLFIMRGNRDFLYGKRFSQQTGATLLPDHYMYQCGAHRALLMHGDLLCTNDTQYLKYRSVVRNPLVQGLMAALPASVRRNIGNRIREKSRQLQSSKSLQMMDITEQALFEVTQKYSVGRVIHGHTHRPGVSLHKANRRQVERFVLGDWGEKIWWITRDVNGFSLHSKQQDLLIGN